MQSYLTSAVACAHTSTMLQPLHASKAVDHCIRQVGCRVLSALLSCGSCWGQCMLGVLLLLLQASPEKAAPAEESQPPLADPAAVATAAALGPPSKRLCLATPGAQVSVCHRVCCLCSTLCCMCQPTLCLSLSTGVIVIDRFGNRGRATLGRGHCCNVQVPGNIQAA